MGIATMRCNGGRTGQPGGARVSKPRPRPCTIHRELFKVVRAIGRDLGSRKLAPEITAEMIGALGCEGIEAMPGISSDWSVSGALPSAAAFGVARTLCHRVTRLAVALLEAGEIANAPMLAYLNQLLEVLWLIGRLLELRAGADAKRSAVDTPGLRLSRAW
jgi:cob(I)alamin adenosyltransferase